MHRCPADGCMHEYDRKKICNLKKHLQGVHRWGEQKWEQWKAEMKEAEREASGKAFIACTLCDVKYRDKRSMSKHMQDCHAEEVPPAAVAVTIGVDGEESPALVDGDQAGEVVAVLEPCREAKDPDTVVCPGEGCEWRGKTRKELGSHCAEAHAEGKATWEILHDHFETQGDFENWLEEIENETKCSFTKASAVKKPGDRYIAYYKCRQAHRVSAKSITTKASHSIREQSHCPAFITATVTPDGETTVEYCKDHYGHTISAALQRLPSSDQEAIQVLVAEDLTNAQVVEKMRKASRDTERAFYLTPQDVQNVRARHGCFPYKLADNDLESVTQRALKQPEDGVTVVAEDRQIFIMTRTQKEWLRRYSHRGIAVDDTHATSRYDYKLMIVAVLDDHDRTLPCLFMYTQNLTTGDMRKAFEVIKAAMPDFKPRCMMTDDTNVFINAYREVFPQNAEFTQKLLCIWHVSHSLKRQAAAKISDRSHTKNVIDTVCELLRESNRVRFKKRVVGLLEYLDKNNLKEFAIYFRTTYLGEKRIKQWGPCYRVLSPFNVNMGVERLNKAIKYRYLHRHGSLRIDYAVHQLLKMLEDLQTRNTVQEVRRLVSGISRLADTHKRHQTAMDNYSIGSVTAFSDTRYEVKSKTQAHRKYQVRMAEDCTCTITNNHCTRCEACPYSWTCTCQDATKAGVVCVHVHVVMLYAREWPELHERLLELSTPSPTPAVLHFDPPPAECEAPAEEDVIEEIFDDDADELADEAVNKNDAWKNARCNAERTKQMLDVFFARCKKAGDLEAVDTMMQQIQEGLAKTTLMSSGEPLPRSEGKKGRPELIVPQNKIILVERAKRKKSEAEAKRLAHPPAPIKFSNLQPGAPFCIQCGEKRPPKMVKKGETSMTVQWHGCGNCLSWLHLDCLTQSPKGLACPLCNRVKQ